MLVEKVLMIILVLGLSATAFVGGVLYGFRFTVDALLPELCSNCIKRLKGTQDHAANFPTATKD